MSRVELQPFRFERDLPLIQTWLLRPHVSRWWGESSKVLSELRTHPAETMALIGLNERPVGLLCWQTPSPSELREAGLADLPRDLIDVDIMIGEPGAQGRGVGLEALRLLFEKLRAQGAVSVGLATALTNQRAMSAYPKVGLRPFRDFVELGEQYRYFVKQLTDATA